jgi:hypothetical protein
MGKTRRRFVTQANGRERGTPGMGDGPLQETSPIARAMATKTRKDMERREARRNKQRNWDED